jgi:hypothetical protein
VTWGEDTIIAKLAENSARAFVGGAGFKHDILGLRARRILSRRCMTPGNITGGRVAGLIAPFREYATPPVVSERIAFHPVSTIGFGLGHHAQGLGASSFGSLTNLVAKPLEWADRYQL